jgi:peptidoglycan hydrolase-like protein with peptidoglycan-binding domain
VLSKKGYDVGEIDGKLGSLTRAAVKDMQIKLGLPADSWPTSEFLAKLRRS